MTEPRVAGDEPIWVYEVRIGSAPLSGLPFFWRKHVYCARNVSHSGGNPVSAVAAVAASVAGWAETSAAPPLPPIGHEGIDTTATRRAARRIIAPVSPPPSESPQLFVAYEALLKRS